MVEAKGIVNDAGALSDPIARAVSWSPLARWAYHFRTHVLVQTAGEQWQLRPRLRTHFQTAFFALIGALAIGVPSVVPMRRPTFTILVGVVLLVWGLWNYVRGSRTMVIDALTGSLQWRTLGLKSVVRRPHALQLIRRQIDGRSLAEVVLVLSNGEREAVFCHSDLVDADSILQKLKVLLRVPVWQRP